MIGGVGSPAGSRSVAGGGRDAGGTVARPGLFDRLGGPARVTVVSAPAGSGKTVLLRSWIAGAGLAGRAAWVAAGRAERDPQRFWLSVAGALRQTGPGAGLVRAVTGAPDLDGWALAEGLLSDLAPLEERVWLVIDDVHELGPDTLRQLELVVMRAPAGLRLVLAARHDVRLGLHRLRLEGGLAELRAGDLRFTLAEAGELFAAAGVELDEPTLAVLHERTEGWAAGLRLAALALAGGADPERFAAEFSGSERTVAEYLLAEVLESQSERVRRLLRAPAAVLLAGGAAAAPRAAAPTGSRRAGRGSPRPGRRGRCGAGHAAPAGPQRDTTGRRSGRRSARTGPGRARGRHQRHPGRRARPGRAPPARPPGPARIPSSPRRRGSAGWGRARRVRPAGRPGPAAAPRRRRGVPRGRGPARRARPGTARPARPGQGGSGTAPATPASGRRSSSARPAGGPAARRPPARPAPRRYGLAPAQAARGCTGSPGRPRAGCRR